MITSLSRAAVFLAGLWLASVASAQPPLPPPDPVPLDKQQAQPLPQPGITVAEKGPIHEAFAQPGAEVRGKDMTAPKAPPAPIPEVPPETKPDGANVQWIPGYWQWDGDKNDFLWVSGFYRNVPAGREWQAGKWMENNGKFVYTPGFWRPANLTTGRTDMPEPPKSVENGPSTPAPASNPDAIWVPGAWEYRNDQFVWRAGYWAAPNGNMVWQPGQYVYTGSGYTYVPGYWDYPLEDRGLLNAPVYVDPQVAQNPGFAYTPQYAIGTGGYGNGGYGNGGLFNSMFMGPGFNNYYYGNYGSPFGGYGGYGGGYGGLGGLGGLGGYGMGGYGMGFGSPLFGLGFGSSMLGLGGLGYGGYYPWSYTGRGYYNPLWRHYNYLNRNNAAWAGNVQRNYTNQGTTSRQTTVVSNNVTTPRVVAAHPTAVGGAAQSAARAAAMTARPTAVVRPANQVLANQAARANAMGVRSGGGPVIVGRPGVSGAGNVGAGMTQIHPGGYSTMPGYRASPSTSYYHPAAPIYHSAPVYHTAPAYRGASFGGGYRGASGFSGGHGGGGGRGGHR